LKTTAKKLGGTDTLLVPHLKVGVQSSPVPTFVAPMSRAAALSVGWNLDGGHTTSICNQPPRPTQPYPLRDGNENRSKCGDDLRLAVKARWLIPFVNKRVGGR